MDAPYSEKAEKAALGALLTNPRMFASVHAFLKTTDFFFLRHAYIYTAMEHLFLDNQPIDPVTMCNRLEAVGQLTEIGGPAYLTLLLRETPTSVHVEVYARLVQRVAIRRQLLVAADEIKAMAINESISLEQVCPDAERTLLAVTGQGRVQAASTHSADVGEYLDGLDTRMQRVEDGKLVFAPTGLQDFDSTFGGSYSGEVMIVGGPAGLGKSTFFLSIARNRLALGLRLEIFSTEMSKDEIIQKWVSMETGISTIVLKSGNLTQKQHSQTVKALGRIAKWKVNVHDSNEFFPLTPLDVRRVLIRAQYTGGCDVCMIDGLWQMKHYLPMKERHEEVNQIMIHLARLAKSQDIPIDVVHQLKRAAANRQDKRPIPSDMGESVGVERNAHIMIGLYRESYYDRDNGFETTEAYVMKNRTGVTSGKIELGFDKQHELYQDAAQTGRFTPPEDMGIHH